MYFHRIVIAISFAALFASSCQSQEQTIEALIDQLASESDWGEARERLLRIGQPAIPHLITALENPNPQIRINAVWTLGGIPNSRKTSAPALISALDDADGRFRSAVVWELGRIGRPANRLFPIFVHELEDDDVHVRVNAADALVRLVSEHQSPDRVLPKDKILEVLCAALTEERVWPPCHAAPILTALGPIARPAIPTLLETLDHPHPLARIAAGRALYRLDRGHADEIVRVVAPALNAEGPWTPDAAAALLEEIGTPEAKKVLKDYAKR
jgi:HEAT repeat protein